MLNFRIFLSIIFQLFFFISVKAQQQTEIKVSVALIGSLRYMQDTPDANEIIKELIARKHINNCDSKTFSQYNFYKKTSIDFVADKASTQQRIKSYENNGNLFYRKYVMPFERWLDYARDVPNTDDIALTVFLQEDYSSISEDHRRNLKDTRIHASRLTGFFESIGQQNILHLLDEAFGDIDLYQNDVELMLLSFKTPLANDAFKTYQYNMLGFKSVGGNDCYEIAFFAKNAKDNAFAGYLYVDISSFALCKAVFTLNNPANMNFLKNILITHTYIKTDDVMCPAKKESAIALGDETGGGLTVVRTLLYSEFDFGNMEKKSWKTSYDADFHKRDSLYWQSIRPVPLTAAQSQIDELVKIVPENTVYTKIQKFITILFHSHITLGGINGKVELGPLFQFISYNDMEGLRLRIGGNTTPALMNQLQIGGYVAYGTIDERWKYRGDLIYSFLPRDKYIWEYPKKLLSFTYVSDLNIPGQDLLTTDRDNLIYSFSHTATDNMSLQKIGLLTFESENKYNFSYTIGAKYTSDEPVGVVKYMKDTTAINSLNTTELNLSMRYAPGERFFQNRDKRASIRRGIVELRVNHRIGVKGILGSDYNYQITNADVFKRISLGNTLGYLDLQILGGKVWTKVPFPLLFIPIGNQSYIFQTENYNCMNFYEFTTDRFVAGNMNFLFNWSPVNWINKHSSIKTNVGGRAIYGPLSDKNNPVLHPDLFVFNEGVTPLGKTPYIEANVGLSNIFKILRIEYARRLTYINHNDRDNELTRGSLLVTASFTF